MYYLIIGFWVALDQLTKALVKANIELGTSIPLVNGVFHLTHINNYGAAFSILQNQRLFFLVMAFIVTGSMFIVITMKRRTWNKVLLLSLSLIVGGAWGNVVDRARLGYVTDFLDFRLINFAIFNVADIGVTCGAALMLYYVFVIDPKLEREKKARGGKDGSL